MTPRPRSYLGSVLMLNKWARGHGAALFAYVVRHMPAITVRIITVVCSIVTKTTAESRPEMPPSSRAYLFVPICAFICRWCALHRFVFLFLFVLIVWYWPRRWCSLDAQVFPFSHVKQVIEKCRLAAKAIMLSMPKAASGANKGMKYLTAKGRRKSYFSLCALRMTRMVWLCVFAAHTRYAY